MAADNQDLYRRVLEPLLKKVNAACTAAGIPFACMLEIDDDTYSFSLHKGSNPAPIMVEVLKSVAHAIEVTKDIRDVSLPGPSGAMKN